MIIVITVKHFRFSTELISDGIKVRQFTFWKFRFTVFNSLSILNIKSSHFHEISIICIVISIELSDNGYFLLSVDVETLTPSIIVFVSKSVWGIIATIFVTNSIKPFFKEAEKVATIKISKFSKSMPFWSNYYYLQKYSSILMWANWNTF